MAFAVSTAARPASVMRPSASRAATRARLRRVQLLFGLRGVMSCRAALVIEGVDGRVDPPEGEGLLHQVLVGHGGTAGGLPPRRDPDAPFAVVVVLQPRSPRRDVPRMEDRVVELPRRRMVRRGLRCTAHPCIVPAGGSTGHLARRVSRCARCRRSPSTWSIVPSATAVMPGTLSTAGMPELAGDDGGVALHGAGVAHHRGGAEEQRRPRRVGDGAHQHLAGLEAAWVARIDDDAGAVPMPCRRSPRCRGASCRRRARRGRRRPAAATCADRGSGPRTRRRHAVVRGSAAARLARRSRRRSRRGGHEVRAARRSSRRTPGAGRSGPPRSAARRTSSWSTRRAPRFSSTRMSLARSRAMRAQSGDAGDAPDEPAQRSRHELRRPRPARRRRRRGDAPAIASGRGRRARGGVGRWRRRRVPGPSPRPAWPARTRRCRGGRDRRGTRRAPAASAVPRGPLGDAVEAGVEGGGEVGVARRPAGRAPTGGGPAAPSRRRRFRRRCG